MRHSTHKPIKIRMRLTTTFRIKYNVAKIYAAIFPSDVVTLIFMNNPKP